MSAVLGHHTGADKEKEVVCGQIRVGARASGSRVGRGRTQWH